MKLSSIPHRKLLSMDIFTDGSTFLNTTLFLCAYCLCVETGKRIQEKYLGYLYLFLLTSKAFKQDKNLQPFKNRFLKAAKLVSVSQLVIVLSLLLDNRLFWALYDVAV